MSEYPIGENGEMVHCLDSGEYAVHCRNKLEREVKMDETEKIKQEIRVSFEQILQKCETVGDLQRLNNEVGRLKDDKR